MRPILFVVLALSACTSGSVKINDGDDSIYDANDHKENEPPDEPQVTLTPSGADTRDDLEAKILFEATDPDGDQLSYDYVWLVNGDPRSDLDGPTVSKSETERDQRWEVRVRAFDGREYGPTATDSVEIGNAPPTLLLRWKNPTPGTLDPLVVRTNKDDPDGDVVELAFTWTVDGAPTPFATETVPAEATSGGEVWSVEVEATDEEGDDTRDTLDVTILNQSPVITGLAISPNPAPPSANLNVTGSIADPDGDAFVTTYAWTVDGVATAFAGPQVPASATEDGQTWTVTVTADDQHGGVTTDTATVDVINHPPTLTTVTIDPSPPGDGDFLFAESNAQDVDGDPLTFTYVWYRNGAVYSGSTSSSVSPTATAPGDTWQVSVSVSDGSALIGPVLSPIETIQNRPPTTPTLVFNPSAPTTCGELQCVVRVASVDPDGTAVTAPITWKKNGVNYTGTRLTTSLTYDTIPAAALVEGDVWSCKVTPTSGGQSGIPAEISATVLGTSATETFTVTARTQADVLLMVDNSGSMSDPQITLAASIGTLLTTLDATGLDYHIGVVTTDMDDPLQAGNMIEGQHGSVYVTPSLATRQSTLSGMINVGTNGSGTEKGLASTKAALTFPLNLGFKRATGGLGILFLTDEDDQSSAPTPAAYATFLRTLRSDSELTMWGILGNPGVGCTFGSGYTAASGDLYADVIDTFAGSWTSICDASYANSLRDFANAVAGLPRRFALAQAADLATLSVVKIAAGTGTRTTLSYGSAYTYDSVTHAVLLTATPVNGTRYEVSYDSTCAP